MTTRLGFEVHRYKATRAALLKEFGDLDEQTLADTAEGLTDFADVLARDVRDALDDETMVALLKIRMSEMRDRAERFGQRAQRTREMVRDAMLDAGVNKIIKEDFTASLRDAPPHVDITDETAIPMPYFEMRKHIFKGEILKAMKDGAHIDGAVLSNPGTSLTVRTR